MDLEEQRCKQENRKTKCQLSLVTLQEKSAFIEVTYRQFEQ